jgi:hypothetical protein
MSGSNGSVNLQNGHAHRFAVALPEDRLPPQNLEAEQGVISAAIRDHATIAPCRSIVRPEDFYRDTHQVLWRAIGELADAGLPVDVIILADHLRRADLYDRIGGDELLITILDSIQHTANAEFHAAIVAEKARARAVIQAANETLRDGYSGLATADELVERWRGRAEAVATARVVRGDGAAASLADVRRFVGEGRWLWPLWIVDSHLTVLAADPGVGKTRLTLDLCRRMWLAEPWPDGELATRPPGTPSLWVAADRNHAEIAHAAVDFALPDEAIRFNAPPEDPFGGLNLDDQAAVADLRRRIEATAPGMVVIDTVNKATRRLLYRPEEAEAFFGPLLDLARDCKVPILALTHLSRNGEPLDRRIEGTCRVMWKLTRPDPEGQPNRRKLAVPKSFAPYPPMLGVTMGDVGNEYDLNPPTEPEGYGAGAGAGPGRPDAKTQAAMGWLADFLAHGARAVALCIGEAETAGHAKRTLYRAKDALGVLTDDGFDGRRKLWRLPDDDADLAGF